jgi:carbon storage regulator CsrA
MLVLTRKQQEQIRIGNQVTITILRISGNQVRVGIEAPPDVRILRGELPAHNEDAATTEAPAGVSVRRDLIAVIRQRLAGAAC